MESSPPSPPPWPSHSTHVEGRLTRLEVKQEDHHERITLLERILWGLIILMSGLAHERLPALLELIGSSRP